MIVECSGRGSSMRAGTRASVTKALRIGVKRAARYIPLLASLFLLVLLARYLPTAQPIIVLMDPLAVIGVILGGVSLGIHLVKFLREKPRLKVEVAYCSHWIVPDPSNPEKVVTKLAARFHIDNMGDRSTTITLIKGKLASTTDASPWTVYPQKGRRIRAHDSRVMEIGVDVNWEIQDELVSVGFTFQHTHGKLEVSHTSTKTSSPPLVKKLVGNS